MDKSGAHTISFFRSQRFTFLSLFMALALVPIILQSIITYWQAQVNLLQTTSLPQAIGQFTTSDVSQQEEMSLSWNSQASLLQS